MTDRSAHHERTLKNGKIELMRFVFSVLVIFYHCHRTLGFAYWQIGDVRLPAMGGGRLSVDFFFLTTGFLMAGSIARDKRTGADRDTSAIVRSVRFFWKKYTSVFPYHAVCFVGLFVLRLYSREIWGNAGRVLRFFVASLPEFFLIQKLGFPAVDINVVEWYLSAMFLATLLLYPFAWWFGRFFIWGICPILGVGLLGWMTCRFGTFSDQDLWTGVCDAGLLRAIAEQALGMSAFALSGYVSRLTLPASLHGLLTVVELSGFGYVAGWVLFGAPSQNEPLIVALLALSITLAFSGQTLWDGWFRNPWILRLGKLSLFLYLDQLLGLNIVRLWITLPPTGIRCLLVLIISIVLAPVVRRLGDWLIC